VKKKIRTSLPMTSLFLLMILATTYGCTEKSKVKTISSNDWFRNGVDRFYLATAPSPLKLPESASVRVGQDILVGVGCFGEPKDPASKVMVESPSCPQNKAKIALNERIRLQDFPMAEDPERPKAGQCVLLLGPSELVKKLKSSPEKFLAPPLSTAAVSAAIATNACGLSLALGSSYFLEKTALKGQISGERESVNFARKMLNYFGENNLAPSVYTNEHPVYALKANENLQGKTPAELAKMEKLLVGQAVLPCSQFSKSVWELLGVANSNDVRKVFFNAMAEADRRTALRVRQGAYFAEFARAVQQGQLRVAAGIYNPIFAYEFNRNVDAKASQGWGGFGAQKFFDEIRKINLELSEI
jgi:hypothetical protein